MTDEFRPVACDYPACIGGECSWDCERNEKHQEFMKWCRDRHAQDKKPADQGEIGHD